MARPLYNVVFVLGPPGSGKGTSCQKIQEVTNEIEYRGVFPLSFSEYRLITLITEVGIRASVSGRSTERGETTRGI